MDPDKALDEIRRLLESAVKHESNDTLHLVPGVIAELQESFQALDEWLQTGGFLPKDWKRDG